MRYSKPWLELRTRTLDNVFSTPPFDYWSEMVPDPSVHVELPLRQVHPRWPSTPTTDRSAG